MVEAQVVDAQSTAGEEPDVMSVKFWLTWADLIFVFGLNELVTAMLLLKHP